MDKTQIVKAYFDCWVKRDFSKITDYFHPDIIYRECYGAVYSGLSEIKLWIKNMLKKQTVIEWNIYRILVVSNDILVVEWFFHAQEEGDYCFDGVSIIEFSNNQIKKISEFESKQNTFRPYEQT
ncbi:nuclear transport factor 2 family protein [Enterococcus sp. LJL90]